MNIIKNAIKTLTNFSKHTFQKVLKERIIIRKNEKSEIYKKTLRKEN